MDEIIFNQFLNKSGDNFLGLYHIQNHYLYYNNLMIAYYENDKIELNTNLANKDILKIFLDYLKSQNIESVKLAFYIHYNLFETYYEILSNYAYYYSNIEYKKNYDLLEILLFNSQELKEEKTLNYALHHLRTTDVKGLNILRKFKIIKTLL